MVCEESLEWCEESLKWCEESLEWCEESLKWCVNVSLEWCVKSFGVAAAVAPHPTGASEALRALSRVLPRGGTAGAVEAHAGARAHAD